MNPLLTVADLLLLTISALAVLTGRPRWWGWVLLLASGLWLPLNNRILEGPVLLVLSSTHGVTVSDVAGVAGAVVAGLRLFPPRRGGGGRRFAAQWALVAAVVVAGFVTAAVVTDVDVADATQRNSLDIRRSASGLPPVWQVGQYWNDLS